MTASDRWRDLWYGRYGDLDDAPLGVPLTETLELAYRHRSVRKFVDEPVGDDVIRAIAGAAQSASTSSNLQTTTIIAVREREGLLRLSESIGGRDYLEHAAAVLVFAVDFARAEALLGQAGAELATADYLENTLVGFADAGIAAQNALLAAESLGLGGVFVGGLRSDPPAVSAALGLPKRVFVAFGVAIGHPDPAEGTGRKPRLPQRAALHWERYDTDAWRGATGYEEAIREYYATQGHPRYSWTARFVSRLGAVKGLHGRERMRAWLAERGLGTK